MKTKEEIIAEAADKAIKRFKETVDSKRDKIIEQLTRQSIHKNEYVIQMDAAYFLEEEFIRYQE